MGIKDFNALIAEKAPSAFIKVPISSFQGKKIAIDSSFLMIAKYKSAYSKILANTDLRARIQSNQSELVDLQLVREEFFHSFFSTIFELLSWDILPVLVLDGTPPEDKNKTLDQRKVKRTQIREAISVLLSTFESTGDTNFELLAKKLRELSPIHSPDVNNLVDLLKKSGLPVIQAPQEADQICAMLATNGLVTAVWSSDTDIPVYGCSLLISKFDSDVIEVNGRPTKTLQVFSLTRALTALNLSYESFVDLCIMLQCDYNQRIKKMGIKRCYECISTIKTLDALNPQEWEVEVLRHHRCRELFRYHPINDLLPELPVLKFDLEMLRTSRNLFLLSEAERIYETLVQFGIKLNDFLWSTSLFAEEKHYHYHPPTQETKFISLPVLKSKSSSGSKNSRSCGSEGCSTRPSFGFDLADETWYCKSHSSNGMVNLTRKKC